MRAGRNVKRSSYPASIGRFDPVVLNKDRTVADLSTVGAAAPAMTPQRRIVPKSAGISRVHNLQ